MATIKDWSLSKYQLLCESIQQTSYNIVTVKDSFAAQDKQLSLILRHDIDRFPDNAIQMAELECKLGIASTYYIRFTTGVFSQKLIEVLNSYGREIGYHYEVMDKAKGNIDEAISIFHQELKLLRQYTEVKTSCAHGSPLSKWDNRLLWQSLNLADVGLIGEASLDMDFSDVAYYTDTGRCWDATLTNIRDRSMEGSGTDGFKSGKFSAVHTTDELIRLIKSERLKKICLQTHPERWSIDNISLMRSVLWDSSTNLAKLIISKLRSTH